MKLSIIVPIYGVEQYLRKCVDSLLTQDYDDYEIILVDDGSPDSCPQICDEYVEKAKGGKLRAKSGADVPLTSNIQHQTSISIFYGNMLKSYDGKTIISRDTCGGKMYTPESFLYFYKGTLNHDCCYIRRDLFETYGLYDESLKIVSDWKWFLQAIGLGKVKPIYVDIDVTIFDASGISETNLALRNQERRQVLAELMPPAVLADYDAHAFEMEQMKRLRRWKLYPLVFFIERVLFKLEKWKILR